MLDFLSCTNLRKVPFQEKKVTWKAIFELCIFMCVTSPRSSWDIEPSLQEIRLIFPSLFVNLGCADKIK